MRNAEVYLKYRTKSKLKNKREYPLFFPAETTAIIMIIYKLESALHADRVEEAIARD